MTVKSCYLHAGQGCRSPELHCKEAPRVGGAHRSGLDAGGCTGVPLSVHSETSFISVFW